MYLSAMCIATPLYRSSGDVIVLGDTNQPGRGGEIPWKRWDRSWATSYRAGPGSVMAAALAVDSERNIFVTGWASNSVPNGDVFLTKLTGSDGTKAWQREYNGAANKSDQGRSYESMRLGTRWCPDFPRKTARGRKIFYTAEFSRENGRRSPGKATTRTPLSSEDKVVAAALDSAGNIVGFWIHSVSPSELPSSF
jgi:hypothetical protein